MGVRNIMEYSIFTSVDYMLEAFESIDRIDVSLTRDNKIATIYLNNRYCDYDITIEDIKKLLNDEEHKCLHFIRQLFK